MKPPNPITRTITIVCLSGVLVLAGIASCRDRTAGRMPPTPKPRFTISELDAKAQPYIDEANAAVPAVVAELCDSRLSLYWMMLRDKCVGGDSTGRHIAEVIGPRIVVPLRKAAAVYKCAVNADAIAELPREAALDNLSRQLYASAGLAIEAVFIRATVSSFTSVLASCAPTMAASLNTAAVCAAADGPLPVGDIVGVIVAIGGTAWSGYELYNAHQALPAEMSEALRNTISATIAQCRQEAANAL